MMRLKSVFEKLLVGSGLASVLSRAARGQAIVLAYHNIVPDGQTSAGDSSLHLPLASFAQQLDFLCESFDVVPLAELLGSGARSDRPRAAITFDDAYRGAVTAGVTALSARGLPATIFVAPAFLGGRSFWWDALADPTTGILRDDIRSRALHELLGKDDRVREWAVGQGNALLEPDFHAYAATEDELMAAAETNGITLGSHSWSHPNLASLPSDELVDQLERPLHWLENRFPNVIPWVSYPYGLSSPEVERRSAAAGYQAGLRVSGGWMRSTSYNRFSLPRLNVPAGMSLQGFQIRMSGLLCR